MQYVLQGEEGDRGRHMDEVIWETARASMREGEDA
jgi:hypothetical protein